MPGKHAPASPKSFILSVARHVVALLTGLGLLVVIVVVALGSDGGDTKLPVASPSETTSAEPEPSVTETPVFTTPTPSIEEPTPETLAPAKVTVIVLNGTTTAGLARTVSDALEKDGYRAGAPGNAPAQEKTTIYFRSSAYREEAQALGDAHPELGSVARATAETRTSAMITVVLGADYSPPE